MEWVTLILGFLGGSVMATLVQVRADWRRRLGERITAGAEAFLSKVDAAGAALDSLAEAGGELEAASKQLDQLLAEVAESRSALTTAPAPAALEAYQALMDEVHEAMKWPGAERASVVRETVSRVQAELPNVLKDSDDPAFRRQASTLGRAFSRGILAAQQLMEAHLAAHQAIDAVRRQRSRLAISLANVPTRTGVLAAADAVVTQLQTMREGLDKAVFNDADPRGEEEVFTARDIVGRRADEFCLGIADAVEGASSRRWRWRL